MKKKLILCAIFLATTPAFAQNTNTKVDCVASLKVAEDQKIEDLFNCLEQMQDRINELTIHEHSNAISQEDVDTAVENAMSSHASTPHSATKTSAITHKTYFIPKTSRKNTVDIPIEDIIALCGDPEGCQLRLGMVNWDNTGRTASRSSLFYYNKANRNWRSERGDVAGTDANNISEPSLTVWACSFTDAVHKDGVHSDKAPGFGLLSGTSHNADCHLTILD